MTEQIGKAHEIARTPGGIPQVSSEIITAFRAEPHTLDQLFNHLKGTNRELADFLLARAGELAPGDLENRQRVAQLALEALGLISSQAEAEELASWFVHDNGVEPDPPAAA